MTSSRVALTVLGVVLFAAGGVQLLDPVFGERPTPEVDFSEPPAEVAADSAERFEHVDYAYRIDIADNRSGPWEQFSSVKVDHTRRRYRMLGPLGFEGTHIFGNDAVTFARPGPDETWRVGYVPETTYPAPVITQPFSVSHIRGAKGVIVMETDSSVVIRLDVNPLKLVDEYPGSIVLHVDKRANVVEKAFVSYEVGPDRARTARFEVVDTGTTVERPDDLSISPREVFWDALRGPLFSV